MAILSAVLLDWEGDILRPQLFSWFKGPAGAAAQLSKRFSEFFLDNGLADILVGDFKVRQKIIIKEVAKGAMPDIVEKSGHPHVLFDVRSGGALLSQNLTEGGVKVPGKLTRKMHCPKGMLEPAVFR